MRKPPVSELVDQDSLHLDYQGLPLLFYRAALPLSSRTLNYAAGIIRRHLKAIGSRWRKLNPTQPGQVAESLHELIDQLRQ